jgi:hypothetical protein
MRSVLDRVEQIETASTKARPRPVAVFQPLSENMHVFPVNGYIVGILPVVTAVC